MSEPQNQDPRSAGRGRTAAIVLTTVMALGALVGFVAFAQTASRPPSTANPKPHSPPPPPPATSPSQTPGGSSPTTTTDQATTPSTAPDEAGEAAEEAAEERDESGSEESDQPCTRFVRNNLTVRAHHTVEGDRYFAGNSAEVEGTIDGDFFALGNDASVTGRVTGDFTALCKFISISGTTDDDVRTMSNNLSVRGKIGGDLIAMAKTVSIAKGAKVAGRTMLFASEGTLDGRFEQPVSFVGGEVTFGGHALGDVKIESDQIHFGDGARIDGNLTYSTSQELEGPEGEQAKKVVAGKITFVRDEHKENKKPFVSRAAGAIWGFTASFLVGCGLILLARRLVRTIIETARVETLMSIGFGLLGHILVPFMALVLLIMCAFLGFIIFATSEGRVPPFPFAFVPVGLLILTVWAVLFYLAKFVVSAALGDTLLRRLGRTPSPYVALFVGMIPVWVLMSVPKLGLFLYFIIVPMFGIGAILVGLRAHFVRRETPARIEAVRVA